jgi:hypothetical protein
MATGNGTLAEPAPLPHLSDSMTDSLDHLTAPPAAAPSLPLAFDREGAGRLVDTAIARYCESRRAAVPDFVDRHFGFAGAWRLHRRALGWDMLRAPANLAMGLPAVGVKAAAATAQRLGRRQTADWLNSRRLFLETDVGRELSWLLYTDLLQLPYNQPERENTRDALGETLMSDQRVIAAFRLPLLELARHADDPAFRQRLEQALANYMGSRTAAADITTSLFAVGAGAVGVKGFTPGMLSLGPAVANLMAQKAAASAGPVAGLLGGLWYGQAAASPLLVAGVTGGLLGAGAIMAAFAGIVTDPVQRRLGLHQRRLVRLVDHLEANLRGDTDKAYEIRDLYVARLLDIADLVRTAHRLTSGS